MVENEDRGDRCPKCEGVNTVQTGETAGEATFRCLNPDCVVGEYTEMPNGMVVYERPDIKA